MTNIDFILKSPKQLQQFSVTSSIPPPLCTALEASREVYLRYLTISATISAATPYFSTSLQYERDERDINSYTKSIISEHPIHLIFRSYPPYLKSEFTHNSTKCSLYINSISHIMIGVINTMLYT